MVVFQVLNLVSMITFYSAYENGYVKINMEEQEFSVFVIWIIIELNMIIYLIVANIFVVLFRSAVFRNITELW